MPPTCLPFRALLNLLVIAVALVAARPVLAAPALLAPDAAATLDSADATFSWDGDGAAITDWWAYLGSAPGTRDLADSGSLGAGASSWTAPALPNDGRDVHLRLWYRDADGWSALDRRFVAPGQAPLPTLVAPPADATADGVAQTIAWDDGGLAVDAWWVYVGTAPGANDVFDSGALAASAESVQAVGLPIDGRRLYATLWYRSSGAPWRSVALAFDAAALDGEVTILAPSENSVLAAGDELTWDADGLPVADWWVWLGTRAGARDLLDSGALAEDVDRAEAPATLPRDGRTVHLTLWYRLPGASWTSVTREFVAEGDPVVISAPQGETLGGGPQRIRWNGTGIGEAWLQVGSSVGARDLYDSGSLGAATEALVIGLPADGSAVHARLWYRAAGGAWSYIDRVWTTPVAAPDLADYELVFADEFDGDALDPTKWNTGLLWGPYEPINNEEQLYVDTLGMHAEFPHSPFDVSDGTLKITATPVDDALRPPARPDEDDDVWGQFLEYRYNGPDDDGPGYLEENVQYLSGIITSWETFKFARGYVEARAKLPAGRGLWPAFWALNAHYVEETPEIDVMEFLGQTPDRVFHTYHYFDPDDDWRKTSTPTFETRGDSWTEAFHTYGMEWSPRQIIWYVDGMETRRITADEYTISKQAMYLLANLAVGGNWPGSPDASTPFPATYEIDYIRAWQRVDPEPVDLDNFQLVFEDEFDGPTLDADKWDTHFIWGPWLTINEERQYYVDTLGVDADKTYSPFSFDDGVLSITARAGTASGDAVPPLEAPAEDDAVWDDWPGFIEPRGQHGPYVPADYTSGILTSREAFMFAYGYAEARMRVPAGDGLWPAFWLLNGYYIAIQPEIDIVELRGSQPDELVHSYHRNDAQGVQTSSSFTTTGNLGPAGYSADFHTFGVRWSPDRITWYVDGEPVHTLADGTVAYQLMYVLVNLAVGGNFPYQPVDDAALPASLDVDYIRIYQEKELR